MRYNPAIVQQQIGNLMLAFPELSEDDVLRLNMLEGNTDLFELLRQVEQKRVEAETNIEALDIEINKKRDRQERFIRREEAMRRLMFALMQTAELKRAELPEATLSIRAGTPKVIITDELAIPDELCRFKREPDKTKLKQALSDGPVTGATLSNAEETLSIRTK